MVLKSKDGRWESGGVCSVVVELLRWRCRLWDLLRFLILDRKERVWEVGELDWE